MRRDAVEGGQEECCTDYFFRDALVFLFRAVCVGVLYTMVVSSVTVSYAQYDDYLIEHFTTSDGLSSNQVTALLQDRRGFLWVGTMDGLNRYDGHHFTTYLPEPNNPHSLSHATINSIFEDRDGVLWIGTDGGGLNRFDPTTDTFTNYQHDPGTAESISANLVWEVQQDSDGDFWVSTWTGGVNKFDPATGRFTEISLGATGPEKLLQQRIYGFTEDHEGILWIGTWGGGFFRLDPITGDITTYKHDPEDPSSLSNDYIYRVYCDRDGMLWLSTWGGGLDRFDPDTEHFTHFQENPNVQESISSDWIRFVKQDRDGMLWVGTTVGLNLFDPTQGTFQHYMHDPNTLGSLSNNQVRSFLEDRQGRYWVGTDEGLHYFQPRLFTHYKNQSNDPNSLSSDYVTALHEDREGKLWVGTLSEGLSRLDPSTGQFTHFRHDPEDPFSISSNQIIALAEDATGRLWVNTQVRNYDQFDPSTGRFIHHEPVFVDNLISGSTELKGDSTGALWMQVFSGIIRLNPLTGESAYYPIDRKGKTHLPSPLFWKRILQDSTGLYRAHTNTTLAYHFDLNTTRYTYYELDELDGYEIASVHKSDKGVLWVGTQGGGLHRYVAETERFISYSELDGLPSNIIYNILEDNQGHLWMTTSQGLAEFDPVAETFLVYSTRDGLQGAVFSQDAYHKGQSGRLYFGGSDGFNMFDPEAVKPDTITQPVIFTSFRKTDAHPVDRSIWSKTELELSHRDDLLSFSFALLDFHAPGRHQYAYMLEGISSEWQRLGKRNEITFTDLPPGSYVLRVKGTNSYGIWNDHDTGLALIVHPPFWEKLWFRLIVGLGVLALILGIYRLRVRSITAHNQQLQKEIKERLRVETEREAFVEELEIKNAELERYAYTVSHDLKNPLVSITGFLGILRRDIKKKDTERIEHDLSIIEEATKKMRHLLDDLLELSRIGRVIRLPETVSLYEVASEAARALELTLRAPDVEITIEEPMPYVVGDRLRLLEVFQNLIGNAAKFMGDQPSPRIEVGAKSSGTEVVCLVRDNGIGIEKAYLKQIFGLFDRLDQTVEGTGVGLALVARIINAHGGKVWAESDGQGKGSTFFFTLPPHYPD